MKNSDTSLIQLHESINPIIVVQIHTSSFCVILKFTINKCILHMNHATSILQSLIITDTHCTKHQYTVYLFL